MKTLDIPEYNWQDNDIESILNELSLYFQDDVYIIEELIAKAKVHFTLEETKMIIKAYIFANDLHRGIKRASGEAYITHPVRVAYILLEEMHLYDASSICAALLHDTIEDTGITREFLEKHFNEDIAGLVSSVSKIKDLNFTSKSEEEQYNTCILLRGLMKDYRVILLKLADRLHNMRTLEYKTKIKQKEKSSETLTLFVPLAQRVGATLVKKELEEKSFAYLNNRRYREIKANVKNYIENHQEEIEDIMTKIESILLSKNIKHSIRISSKNPFEVFCVLKSKEKLSSIPDLITYEIVVDTKEDCYLALCYLESFLHPIEAILKNYIASPKPNGYRAIHTIVSGFKDHPIELKICSRKMHLLNEYGLAALTELYPEKSIQEIQEELNKNNKFINALKEIDDLYQKDEEFIKQVTEEILSTQVKVYSKDGEIYNLPKGATALDFAYKIHTNVGDKAVSAIVNGKVVPLKYVLKENDSVIILIDDLQIHQPSESEEFVKTALAKKKIREGVKELKGFTRKRIK